MGQCPTCRSKIDVMPKVSLKCEECGESFERFSWEANRSKHHFCSRGCVSKSLTWNNPSHSRKPRALILSHTDAAWLAGLFDGEGCIIFPQECPSGRIRKERARIVVGMTCKELIYKLQSLSGVGHVQEKPPQFAHHSVQWTWAATGPNAAFLLKQMLPWLIVKRERAEKAIAMYAFNFAAIPSRRNLQRRTQTKPTI